MAAEQCVDRVRYTLEWNADPSNTLLLSDLKHGRIGQAVRSGYSIIDLARSRFRICQEVKKCSPGRVVSHRDAKGVGADPDNVAKVRGRIVVCLPDSGILAAAAIRAGPSVPPVPPRFSTTIGCPKCFSLAAARARNTTSVVPPAEKGTIRVTGREGKTFAVPVRKMLLEAHPPLRPEGTGVVNSMTYAHSDRKGGLKRFIKPPPLHYHRTRRQVMDIVTSENIKWQPPLGFGRPRLPSGSHFVFSTLSATSVRS
jgi:hypothetical protein